MNLKKGIVLSLVLVFATSGLISMPAQATGQAIKNNVGRITGKTGASTKTVQAIIPKVIKVILFLVGVAAVVMIVIGGIRYSVSAGNEKMITAAKHTIIYAVVGLVVAILGYAIVNFVSNSLLKKTTPEDASREVEGA